MQNLFGVLVFISLILFVVGLISPKTSLFWYKKERTRKLSAIIYGGSLIVCFLAVGILSPTEASTQSQSTNSASTDQSPALSEKQKDSIAERKQETEMEERRKITFTAGELVSSYTKNEVSADNNFKGKSFYVVGYIDRIGKDIMDNTYLTLKSGDEMRSVQCFVEDQDVLAKLQTDQKVTVYGECDGLMMNVLMKNCRVVDNLPSK